jgi:hypothetical protein
MKETRKREEEQMRRSERPRGTDNFSDAAAAAGHLGENGSRNGELAKKKGKKRKRANRRKSELLAAKAAAAGSEGPETKSILGQSVAVTLGDGRPREWPRPIRGGTSFARRHIGPRPQPRTSTRRRRPGAKCRKRDGCQPSIG